MSLYLSSVLNILLVLAFIIDRVLRLRSAKEYREAKEAQIANLQQQLDNERRNNDVQIAEMHKKRYENLKLILDEKELEITKNQIALLELSEALGNATEKAGLVDLLIKEINRVERAKHDLEVERKIYLSNVEL